MYFRVENQVEICLILVTYLQGYFESYQVNKSWQDLSFLFTEVNDISEWTALYEHE